MDRNSDRQLVVADLQQLCLDLYDRNVSQEAKLRTLNNVMADFRTEALFNNAHTEWAQTLVEELHKLADLAARELMPKADFFQFQTSTENALEQIEQRNKVLVEFIS